ncbi:MULTISPECIES: HAD family hydrolase [Paenibacillus]|uniref:HAD family hydrolase n=1 Tax=Paenibacillus TaxID=44249 RepID=UPI0022B8AFE8|nr:HAD-IA family hydrolase [Paenibacillus caseinilyticus]MCZ8518322.1 HAD-IA family hydrolase [Paenibacillus caseinilyticus]
MKEASRMNGKTAVCFDVNQTLVQQGLSFEQCFRHIWEDYTARWLQEEAPRQEDLWAEYITRWQQRKKVRTTFKQLDELQQQCLREALLQFGVPVSAGFARSFMEELRGLQVGAKTLMPRTAETLEKLAQSHRLAIISNSPRSEVLLMLGRFGLSGYFPQEHIFTAARPADKKPAPALFRAALHSLGVTARQAVMVGNSWKHDVCGAVKAGMDAVWLNGAALTTASGSRAIAEQRLGKRRVVLIRELDQLEDVLL